MESAIKESRGSVMSDEGLSTWAACGAYFKNKSTVIYF